MRSSVVRRLGRLSLSLLCTAGLISWEQSSHASEAQMPVQMPQIAPPISTASAQIAQFTAQVTDLDQALLDAVSAGRLGDVRVALERGADPDAGDLYSGYALASAATLGYTEIVQLLLERGAKVDIAADEGYRPLIEAIVANQTSIVQLLLEEDADPNRVTSGLTPLEFAIQSNNPAIVKLLLQAGATVKPADGRDLLAVAKQQGNAEIIQMIQQAQP
ncbi:MAG: ankyrin repeat domain-containing protein [Pegethrix bostrychoides GSE-TBD4-15B]|uniref:Ankyrin repeat domain-containing protein n=1 Tax=Pegethrix bostrychoides GSE-TBD4-15B TaxID=2839662 RepID=A0A951PER5_9CYAN|nr:ankyrin repeat domain-containing protein [Pegethrix bostrychoides GSE-TBD4-15B]